MQPSRVLRKARFVILDRDGTIIEDCFYLWDPEQLRLLPGACEALRDLKQMGLGLIIVTNQSGLGRGMFDEAQLELIHQRLLHILQTEGIQLDGIYVCPHKPEEECSCRKPKIGLIERASKELGFDTKGSIVIGDKLSDIEMGRQIGATTFLVRSGRGSAVRAEQRSVADYIVDDLLAAAKIIQSLIES